MKSHGAIQFVCGGDKRYSVTSAVVASLSNLHGCYVPAAERVPVLQLPSNNPPSPAICPLSASCCGGVRRDCIVAVEYGALLSVQYCACCMQPQRGVERAMHGVDGRGCHRPVSWLALPSWRMHHVIIKVTDHIHIPCISRTLRSSETQNSIVARPWRIAGLRPYRKKQSIQPCM